MMKTKAQGSCVGTLWDECGKNQISRIYIATEKEKSYEGVASIQFGYAQHDDANSIILSEKHGGVGADFFTIKLDYPSEYLITIRGLIGNDIVKHIGFETNKRKFGVYGCGSFVGGEDFYFQVEDDFYGFHGYSTDRYLCAIGVYVKPNASLQNATLSP